MTQHKSIRGTLIPVGGNEDKGAEESESYSMDFVTNGILAHVVRESGGNDARFVVVTAASSIPMEVGEMYLDAFKKLDCENVSLMTIDKRMATDRKEYIKLVEEADCVLFSGGDQSKIVAKMAGTQVHKILSERYQNEDFVIAGTSAGAMCMATEMIAGGSSADSFFKGAVDTTDGMNFIPELIIDSHFIQRGRFGRLAESVARFPHLLGIGLAEDTGIIIKNGNDCRVIGSGMVIMMDPAKLTHNNEKLLPEGTPMTLTNLVVHVLSNSDGFSIDTREIDILPIEADFI